LVVGVGRRLSFLRKLSAKSLELCLCLAVFGAVAPGLVPINVGVRTRGCTNDFEHPLGRIGIRRALMSTIAFEVRRQNVRTLANFAKVDSLTTSGEEEKTIETLEQHGRRLVNSAENGLTGLGKLLHQIADSPGGLRVETGGRFVQEEKELRLSSKLNTDSQTLTLLNVETFTRHTNNGISVFFHVQELDNLIDIVELLLTRDVGRLAE